MESELQRQQPQDRGANGGQGKDADNGTGLEARRCRVREPPVGCGVTLQCPRRCNQQEGHKIDYEVEAPVDERYATSEWRRGHADAGAGQILQSQNVIALGSAKISPVEAVVIVITRARAAPSEIGSPRSIRCWATGRPPSHRRHRVRAPEPEYAHVRSGRKTCRRAESEASSPTPGRPSSGARRKVALCPSFAFSRMTASKGVISAPCSIGSIERVMEQDARYSSRFLLTRLGRASICPQCIQNRRTSVVAWFK